jgi:hypothetical protein
VTTGDLNDDGKLDLVTATTNSQGHSLTAVFLGAGSGNFGPPSFYPSPPDPSDVALFDVNNDGRLDVVVAGHGAISIMLGDGTGKLGLPMEMDSHRLTQACLAAVDVNGDLSQDLLIGGPASFFSVLINDCPASSHFFFPQVASGKSDSVTIRSEINLMNVGPDSDVTVDFFDTGGRPMALSFNGQPPASRLFVALKSGQHYSGVSSVGDQLGIGYAEVRSQGLIGGTAVYSCRDEDEVIYEAGVPATRVPARDMTFFAGNGEGHASAVALINSSSESSDIWFRSYSSDFRLLATRSAASLLGRPLAAKEHFAKFAFEMFPDYPLEQIASGTVTAQADQRLSAVSLQLLGSGAQPGSATPGSLTVLPVSNSRADQNPASQPYSRRYFPQIADGGQGSPSVATRVLLFNAGCDSLVRLEFLNDDGSPMQVDLREVGVTNRLEFLLSRGATWLGETRGNGPLQKGYAVLTARQSVAAGVVFVYRQDGTVTGETSVPAVRSRSSFRLMVPECNSARESGIAMINPGRSTASVRLVLYDNGVSKVADKQLTIEPGGQTAKFLAEIFTGISEEVFNQATVRVESDQPLAAVNLLQARHPSRLYPDGRYLLTLLPVEPE